MIINKYIQIFKEDKWFIAYATLDYNKKIIIWYPSKKPFNDSFIDSKFSNRETWKLFCGHKYFIELLSTNKLKYLPREIREIIWKHFNTLTI